MDLLICGRDEAGHGLIRNKYVCFAATDNYRGGVIAARRMGEILGGKGKVVVIKYVQNHDSTTNRENGFIETIEKEFPGIEIVDAEYAGDTVDAAINLTKDMLSKHSGLDGLYACNAPTSVGAKQALAGGRGTITGTIIGTLLISFLRNGCTMLDISTNVQLIVIGGIIIAAVAVDQLARSRAETGRAGS